MKRITLWIVVGVLLVAGVWFAGKKGIFKTSESATSASSAGTPDKAAEKPKDDPVIATVNGEAIHQSEFAMAVQGLPANAQAVAAKAAGQRMILDEIVKLKILKQEAERRGIDKDPVVLAQLATLRDNVLASAAIEKLANEKPEDMRAFYDKYKDQFRQTKLRQILVAFQGGIVPPKSGTAISEADAMKKAEAIAARLRKGEDFATVARAESDDQQTGQAGGELGLVRPGQLGRVLEPEVDKLKVGEVSGPIKSAFGVHIFQVESREIAKFEEVEPALKQQGANLRAQVIVNALREKASVETHDEFFKDKVQ